jgi:IS605 OrfB family transposase
VKVVRAYRYALDPTPNQVRNLLRHAGAARKAYNWALDLVKANLDQRKAERSYDIPDDQLTPPVGWNLPALRREWNQAKNDVAPWWRDCSKEAYNTGLDQLARGLHNWSDSRSGKRAGPKIGFPRRKRKRRATPSVRFTTGAIRVEADRHHITLPRLGTIHTHESTRELARRLEAGAARIMSATVRRDGGRWYVSFTCEVDRTQRVPAQLGAVAGVDVGIKHLAVLSTGGVIANPRHLDSAQRRLRRFGRNLSRKVGPDRRTGQRPSKRWEKANTHLGRAHARVANLRRDGLHKLTTALAKQYGTVVVEDLNVSGMLRNHKLARAISDCGFAELRRQLSYKTEWYGGNLAVADRWYPSSKTCSVCGAVKPKLSLHVRTFICESCGMVLDRDLNAARNLAQLVVAGSGPETINGRGANRKTPHARQAAVKRLPGAATTGKTGTVPPQGGTTNRVLTRAR